MKTLETKSKQLKVAAYERGDRQQDHGTRGNDGHYLRGVKDYDRTMRPMRSDKQITADEVAVWLDSLSPEDQKYVLDGQDDVDHEYLEAYGLTKDSSEYSAESEHASSTPLHLDPTARDEIDTTRAVRRKHLARAATLDPEKAEDDTHDYSDGMSIRLRP